MIGRSNRDRFWVTILLVAIVNIIVVGVVLQPDLPDALRCVILSLFMAEVLGGALSMSFWG